MADLARVLAAFGEAYGCGATLWLQPALDAPLEVAATAGGDVTPPTGPHLADDDTIRSRETALGRQLVARVPGRTRAWLGLGPVADDDAEPRRWMRVLIPVLAQLLQGQWEASRATDELAERYEEINLLYSISEILGRTVTLEEAARTILLEVAETVGAEYGALFVHDAGPGLLRPVTALRLKGAPAALPIPTDDPVSVTARVFRTRAALLVNAGVLESEYEAPFRAGAMLTVPIVWTTPDGGIPLGVVCLSGRRGGAAFTAGDEKLVAAVGSQIGTAIQNARLVRASIDQERLASEMRLAHDLQMRLLPDARVVAPDATCAARVEAADGVGGDFYHLFPLGPGRTGVLIGDVSSHGYRAALIMALVMSAAAIHAQTTADPAETVQALLATVEEELRETEMFLSLCYAVVDRAKGVLRWTNTGHPHAFVIGAEGEAVRLEATDPPLGLGPEGLHAASRPWGAHDLLVMFTDGVSDARDAKGRALGEARVLEVLRARRREVPSRIVDGVFALVEGHMGRMRPHDDQAVVALRTA
ncbi:MAG: SpoIIE family protein phosphatase [Gemmatimonadaceae bacterium]|nr:SpoIIE family protein phosphatase [Gemmatimonadaceae bacterium]